MKLPVSEPPVISPDAFTVDVNTPLKAVRAFAEIFPLVIAKFPSSSA
jgi:hypothetical protein